jgi:hypothetical protein
VGMYFDLMLVGGLGKRYWQYELGNIPKQRERFCFQNTEDDRIRWILTRESAQTTLLWM